VLKLVEVGFAAGDVNIEFVQPAIKRPISITSGIITIVFCIYSPPIKSSSYDPQKYQPKLFFTLHP
jgi:hypothetical protein